MTDPRESSHKRIVRSKKMIDKPIDFLIFFFLLFFIVGMGHFSTTILYNGAKDEIVQTAIDEASVLEARLESEIANIDGAVDTLADLAGIQEMLTNGSDLNFEYGNSILDSFKDKFNVSVCYVMNLEGITIASSNRNEEASFVGNNYSFRPYFKSALTFGHGEYFALGVTSGKRGYYNSAAVKSNGITVGVAVIKRDLGELESIFAYQKYGFLTSPEGLIFLSSVPDFRYKTIGELSDVDKNRLTVSEQFGSGPFEKAINEHAQNGEEVDINGERFYVSKRDVTDSGWSVVIYHSLRSLNVYSIFGILFTSSLVILLCGSMFYFRHRRRFIKKIIQDERMIIETNKRLNRSDKIKGEYLSIIAHDIGSPLTGAKGHLELLRNGMNGELSSKQVESVNMALIELERINEIRKESMDMNRETRNKSTLNLSEFNLNELIGEIMERYSKNPNFGNRRFRFSPLSNEVISADRKKLKIAIENYVSNAVRYSDDNTTIQLGAERRSSDLTIWVKDDGRGLEKEDTEMVFEMFFRTGEKVNGSSGLGLAIVKAMIERHGGNVWVNSDGLGMGSTFYLSIPLNGN